MSALAAPVTAKATKAVVVVVGHTVYNNFNVLGVHRPPHLVCDTAHHLPCTRPGRSKSCPRLPRKLLHLTKEFLGESIQTSTAGHCSVEDAGAVLRLYWRDRVRWEGRLGHQLRGLHLRGLKIHCQ